MLARSDPEVQTRCPDEHFPGSINLGMEPCGSTPDRKRSDSTGHPGRLHHQNYPGSDKPPSRCNCDPSHTVMEFRLCLPGNRLIGTLAMFLDNQLSVRHIRLCRVVKATAMPDWHRLATLARLPCPTDSFTVIVSNRESCHEAVL